MGLFDKKMGWGGTLGGFGENPIGGIFDKGPSLLEKVDMLLTDVETEGKKQGYARAVAEYDKAFRAIEGEYDATKNIMTNSLTKTDFETYQVKNMQMVRHYPLGVAGMLERAVSYSVDDPKLLAVRVARQAIHFGSDYFTKQGLPVPLIATVNNGLTKNMLSEWHIDMWSITRGMALSTFINQLIAIMHGLFYTGTTEMDRKLYEVRTRKILSYSNLIATSSNIAVVAITHDMRKLDIGGMAVTIYRLITDVKFIRQVKEEFIFGSYRKIIMGDDF